MASQRIGTLYIGVTSNLVQRVYKHKNKLIKGFTSKYNVNRLVYYEHTESIEAALKREKNLKVWKRAWKIKLIESVNPNWADLSNEKIDLTTTNYSGSLPSQG